MYAGIKRCPACNAATFYPEYDGSVPAASFKLGATCEKTYNGQICGGVLEDRAERADINAF